MWVHGWGKSTARLRRSRWDAPRSPDLESSRGGKTSRGWDGDSRQGATAGGAMGQLGKMVLERMGLGKMKEESEVLKWE